MWSFIALFSAFTYSIENIFTKKSGLHFNAFIVTWAILAISSLFYLPLLFVTPIPHLNNTFWIAVFLRLFLDSAALVTYVIALKKSPISAVAPMSAFNVVFVLITSMIINHLYPSITGLIGVAIIIGGVYYLHFDKETKHILSPFKSIAKEKGVLLMFVSILLWSIVTSLRRLGIDNSSLYFYTPFFQVFWAICFTPLAYFSARQQFHSIFSWNSTKLLLPLGLLDGIQVLSYNASIKLTIPAYASSVRSTSILFSSLLGWYFFKEKLGGKIVPIIILLIGVVILSLSSAH